MKYATQVRFQLEMGLIELAQISKLRPLEDLVAEFSVIAGGNAQVQGAPLNKSGTMPGARPQAPRSAAEKKPDPPSPAPEDPKPGAPELSDDPPASETAPPAAARDSREFLLRIASAVGREALESCLHNLAGARIQGERVILEPGNAGEFVRRQIKENLPSITQAASKVVGNKVTVVLGELEQKFPSNHEGVRAITSTEGDLLEKVKKEPVVRSFLDVFPGPVKAEKIDS